jgi:hypothetical protein
MELMARAPREHVQAAELATTAAAAGMKDEAIRHARQAIQLCDLCPFKLSKYWLYSTRLRQDHRFEEILLGTGIE